MDSLDFVDLLKWYLVFLFSTSAHEAAHAWAALKLGDDTAHRGGQVTLDPTPHIKRAPMGMVVVPIVSFLAGGWMIGWASAPYNVAWALTYPRRAALMALTGPLANFTLVILAAIAIKVGIAAHYFQAPFHLGFTHLVDATGDGLGEFSAKVLSITFSLNLLLGTFNLLPLPPLDGSSLPLLFTQGETTRKLYAFIHQGGLQMIGLFIAWKVFGTIFHPILLWAVNLLYPSGGSI
ncbi:MAG: site-2 protease family protein [Chthoniobacteraceae bacterium]